MDVKFQELKSIIVKDSICLVRTSFDKWAEFVIDMNSTGCKSSALSYLNHEWYFIGGHLVSRPFYLKYPRKGFLRSLHMHNKNNIDLQI